MVNNVLLIGGVLGMLASVGCSQGPSLRARSAGDLHCPAESVKIFRLDDRAYRVVGCEQEAVYLSTCDAPVGSATRECTWVLDSRRNPVAKPTVAVAPGCSFDTQCKGDRVCVNRECVAPPTAPSIAPSP